MSYLNCVRSSFGKAAYLLTHVAFLQHSLTRFSKYSSRAGKIVLYSWWAFSWAAIWYHQATLTSKLIIPEMEPELQRLRDLFNPNKPRFLEWRTGTTIYRSVVEGTVNGTKLENVATLSEYFNSFDQCIHKLLTKERYACIQLNALLDLWIKAVPPNVQRKLVVKTTEIFPLVATFTVAKHFPFLDKLDKTLQRLLETGLLQRWEQERRNHFGQLVELARHGGAWNDSFVRIFQSVGADDKNSHVVRFGTLVTSFLLLHSVAVVIFLGELIAFCCGRRSSDRCRLIRVSQQ